MIAAAAAFVVVAKSIVDCLEVVARSQSMYVSKLLLVMPKMMMLWRLLLVVAAGLYSNDC